jgi:O-antigen ligase
MNPNPSTSFPSDAAAWRRDDRHALWLAAMMWVLIVLMIVPEGLDYQSLNTPGSPSSGDFISRMLWLGLLVFGSGVILWRAGLAWLLARTVNPFLLLFVLLAVASVAWSIDPSLTARRLVRLGTMVVVCTAFVLVGWHARRFQNVVRPILTLMLVGSLAFGLVYPSLAIHQEPAAELVGAWRGLANHKNGLGALASITLVLWLHAGLASEVTRGRALAGIVVAATCLVLSRSATSMAATLLVAGFLLLSLRAPRGLRPLVPGAVTLLVVVALVYALAIVNLIPGLGTLMAPITLLTEVDTSLTGRTQIWAILSEHISQRPLLGSGFGAYWTGAPAPGDESYVFLRRMGNFYPGSAHNGYLEVVNDLGWVGLTVLLGYIVLHVRQSLWLLGAEFPQGVLFLALFFQQAVTNLSETHWFSVLSVDFVVMTLASLALARGLLENRLYQVFGQPHAVVGSERGRTVRPRGQAPARPSPGMGR